MQQPIQLTLPQVVIVLGVITFFFISVILIVYRLAMRKHIRPNSLGKVAYMDETGKGLDREEQELVDSYYKSMP